MPTISTIDSSSMSKLSCNLFFFLGDSGFSLAKWRLCAEAEWMTSLLSLGEDRRWVEFFPRSECPLCWNDCGARDSNRHERRVQPAPFQYLSQEQQTLFRDLQGAQPQSLFQAADQRVDTWSTNQRVSDSALHMMELRNKTSTGSRPSHLSYPPPCQSNAGCLLSDTLTATAAACVRVTDVLVKTWRGAAASQNVPRRSNLSPHKE